jgi:hypothetical protein
MAEERTTSWNMVWVKDRDGNEFACPANALKKASDLTPDEQSKCFDTAAMAVGGDNQ